MGGKDRKEERDGYGENARLFNSPNRDEYSSIGAQSSSSCYTFADNR